MLMSNRLSFTRYVQYVYPAHATVPAAAEKFHYLFHLSASLTLLFYSSSFFRRWATGMYFTSAVSWFWRHQAAYFSDIDYIILHSSFPIISVVVMQAWSLPYLSGTNVKARSCPSQFRNKSRVRTCHLTSWVCPSNTLAGRMHGGARFHVVAVLLSGSLKQCEHLSSSFN